MLTRKSVRANRWIGVVVWLLFLFVSGAFSLFYVFALGASLEGGLRHVGLVGASTAAVLAGLSALSVITKSSRISMYVCMVVMTLYILAGTLLYAAAYIGLRFWGQVPTVQLLLAYTDELGSLLAVLGISTSTAVGVAIAVLLVHVVAGAALGEAVWRAAQFQHTTYPSFWGALKRVAVLLLALTGASATALAFVDPQSEREIDEPLRLVFSEAVSASEAETVVNGQGLYKRPRYAKLPKVVGSPVVLDEQEQLLRQAYVPSTTHRGANVVLITVDALRPDHLPVYGYDRQTSPHLSRMLDVNGAHAATRARAVCAESWCGILSLLSGKGPHNFAKNNFSLADVLGMHGYKRVFLLSGDHTYFYGLRAAYGNVDKYEDGQTTRSHYVNDDVGLLEKISRLPRADGTPHFFFFHLMSAHGVGSHHDEHKRWTPAASHYTKQANLTDADKQEVVNFYDNGVLQADDTIKQIVGRLTDLGYIKDDTLILVTADHGESLGENGLLGHSRTLFEPVLRIPWIWIGPNPQAALEQPVSQADFAPTALTYLGMPIPPNWTGLPLQAVNSSRELILWQEDDIGLLRFAPDMATKFTFSRRSKEYRYVDLTARDSLVNERPLPLSPQLLHEHVEVLRAAGLLQR